MKKLILIMIICLFLIACKEVEKPEVPAIETPVAQPTTEPIVPEEPEIKPLLTELRCVDDKISGVVSNNEESSLRLAKDIKVLINGLLVIDPTCDSLDVPAKGKVFCQDLSGHFPIREGQANTVKLNLRHDSVQEIVRCE